MEKVIKKRIIEIDRQIADLTLQRKKLVETLGVDKVRKENKFMENSLCYTLFGKKHRDLTESEKKDYQRILNQRHYKKRKEQ